MTHSPSQPQPDPGLRPARAPSTAMDPLEASRRQRRLLLRAVRAGFLVLVMVVVLLNIINIQDDPTTGGREIGLAINWWIPVGAALLLGVIFLTIDIMTPQKRLATISGVILGLLAGLVAAVALGYVVDLIAATWDLHTSPIVGTVKVLFGIALCYLGVTTVLQTQDDFRLVIPYVEFAKQLRGPRPLLLDSSAIIDARIVEIAETGLIQSPVVIPSFVVSELQLLADNSDKMTRAKGRRGLDIVGRLQRLPALDVSIDETPIPGKAVDAMLVELARRLPGMVVTTDVGLSRVAEIQGVPVLNVNDLANAMKPSVIPGETLRLKIIKPGEQPGQGVGYLDDGTMVVAEDGSDSIGLIVDLKVTSSLQTSAGRLIFGRINEPSREPDDAADALASPETPRSPSEPSGEKPDAPPTNGSPQPPRSPRPVRPPRGASPRNPRR
ncbi:MAG: PIN/TRAM domain-containing protein [Phycisphaerales bacterium JB059]